MSEEPSIVDVVAAVISEGDTYLLCQRPLHKHHGGLWEFPGGKVNPGESFKDAVKRELHEELGLNVASVGQVIHSIQEQDSIFRIHFIETETKGVPQLHEHLDSMYCTIFKMRKLPLAPADQKFALILERN